MRKYRTLCIFCFLFSLSFPSFCQNDSAHQVKPLRFDKYYIWSGILDTWDQFTAPFHWNGNQWLTAGVLATTESLLMFAGGDKSIESFAQRNRNSTTNFLETNIGDPFGAGLYPGIIVGSSYLIGCVFHLDHPKRMAMLAAKSITIAGVTTTILKLIAERHRPYQTIPPNPNIWDGPKAINEYVSFPSGHTTVAFATASSIAMAYPKPLIIPILAYSIATFTAFGRINGDWHWGSDVLMGAAIGYFTSRLVFRHNNWWKCLQHRKSVVH
jgi:membrane-associated phospholipid phosphatase